MYGEAQSYFYNERYYESHNRWEVGIGTGIINTLTDLGGRGGHGKAFLRDLNLRATRIYNSLFVAFNHQDKLAARFELGSGNIYSGDNLLANRDPDLSGRYGRNLSFESKLQELSLTLEWHPFPLSRSRFSAYLVNGIGFFHFNPTTMLDGQRIYLHPLRLEGQGFDEYPSRKPYRLFQWNIPAGAGLSYDLGARLSLRLELVYRVLFTDYLDDVSTAYIDPALFSKYLSPENANLAQQLYSRMHELQPGFRVNPQMERGDSRNNDGFFTLSAKFAYVFRRKR